VTLNFDIDAVNRDLGRDPEALIRWALELDPRAFVSSNFRPFAAVMLHMVTRQKPDIPVVWMDSGYNTETTYRYADEVAKLLKLDLRIYLPLRSRAHREALEGPPPPVDDPRIEAFTREVKLEPFDRAVAELQPKVWLTGLRGSDSSHRAQMQPVSVGDTGLIKVAPLLHWTSKELYRYLKKHDLPDNFDYYDPTKGEGSRECGLQTTY